MSNHEQYSQDSFEGFSQPDTSAEPSWIYHTGVPDRNILKTTDRRYTQYGIIVSHIFPSVLGAAVRIRTEVSVQEGADIIRPILEFKGKHSFYFVRAVPIIVGEVRDLQLPSGLWPQFD